MATRQKNLIYTHTIGEILRAWRQERQLSLTDYANRCGLLKGYLSQVENNKIGQPDDDHLLRMADALVIPVDFFLSRILPDDLSSEERDELDEAWETQGDISEEEGDINFASPLDIPLEIAHQQRPRRYTEREELAAQPASLSGEEQLHLILEKLSELQTKHSELQALVQTFLAQRGKK